jgi:acetyl esterase
MQDIRAAPFVRPDVRAFLDALAKVPGPKIHELDPPAARQLMLATSDVGDLPLGTLAVQRTFSIPGPAGTLAALLFDAREHREPGPCLVFYHGGGFVVGSIATHASLCAEIARVLDLPVVSIDYRLAPEYPWPAAPDDAEAAARWIATSPEALGRKVTSLVLAGDSAGGTLAIIVAMALRDAPAAVPVLAHWPIYPAVDMRGHYPSQQDFAEGYLLTRASLDWFTSAYAAEPDHVRATPLNGDLSGMPPALVLTAGLDPVRDQGRAYAAALVAAGVPTIYREAAGNVHGFATLRRAIPSSAGDLAGALAVLRPLIAEAEAERVMAQAQQG